MAWYVSRSVRMGELYYRAEGPEPEVQYLLHPNKWLREHAQWMLDTKARYKPEYRWPWWSLRIPPRPYELRWYAVSATPVEWVLSRALTAWVLWRVLRSRARA